MADSWLKPFSRHSKVPSQESPALEHSSGIYRHDGNEGEEYFSPRFRPAARVSSYIGLHPPLSSTPPPPLPPPPPDTFTSVRHPESVYYKPSGDELAETLKVVMMNQDLMTSLPIEYNSCILHILEAYQQLREGLSEKEVALEAWKQQHLKDIRDMEELKVEWNSKETEYKTDIKRLEVLLSENPYGMEQVMILRSKSLVHGSKNITERVERSVNKMKERSITMKSRTRTCLENNTTGRNPIILNDEIRDSVESPAMDITIPTTERARKLLYDRKQTHHPNTTATITMPSHNPTTSVSSNESRSRILSRLSDENLHTLVSPQMTKSKQHHRDLQEQGKPIISHLKAIEGHKTEEEFGFHSSPSSADSSTYSIHEQSIRDECSVGLGIHERSLSRIPTQIARKNILEATCPGKGVPEANSKNLLGFSFQPGDDIDLFAEDTARTCAIRKQFNKEIRRRRQNHPKYPKTTNLNPPPSIPNSTVRPGHTSKQSLLGSSCHDSEPLTRDDSSSSVITTARQNSNRSIIDSPNDQYERQRNEATTAAARAFKGKEKRTN